jgi:hypothetical protein
MSYTANTKEGASCIALARSSDLQDWEDCGPILIGASDGYEPCISGGHPQGQLESSNLIHKNKRWFLLVQESRRGTQIKNWVYESETMDRFSYVQGREFWPGAYTVEVVKERGTLALLACAGAIRFGVVDWAAERPVARYITTNDELALWRD